MKVTFRIFDKHGSRRLTDRQFNSSSAAWAGLEAATGMKRERLKELGNKVKRHVDVSDTEEAIAVAVAEEVIGPKKVGLIRGIFGAIFK